MWEDRIGETAAREDKELVVDQKTWAKPPPGEVIQFRVYWDDKEKLTARQVRQCANRATELKAKTGYRDPALWIWKGTTKIKWGELEYRHRYRVTDGFHTIERKAGEETWTYRYENMAAAESLRVRLARWIGCAPKRLKLSVGAKQMMWEDDLETPQAQKPGLQLQAGAREAQTADQPAIFRVY
jgi:hypothetical protein